MAPPITQVRCPKPRPVHWEDESETEKRVRHQAKPANMPLQWINLTSKGIMDHESAALGKKRQINTFSFFLIKLSLRFLVKLLGELSS